MSQENFGVNFATRGYHQTHGQMSSIVSKSKMMQTGFTRLGARAIPAIGGITRGLMNMKTAIVGLVAGYGLAKIAQGFMTTASKMDAMKDSLDTITKGHGLEWFEKLNEWALKMPVNTTKAIQSFIMMRAMGLKPTIKDMTTLVDTASALGGKEGTLEGIARALGQIKTKGKVSAEELMQLAERGVPAYEILRQKLGLTAKQLGNIGNEGIDAGKAVEALLEGMGERFGGMSQKIQSRWRGMIESLKSYWTEFKRLVMESGPMRAMESSLSSVVKKIDELKESGRFDEYAKKVGVNIIDVIARVVEAIGWLPSAFYSVGEAVTKTTAFIVAMGQAAINATAFIAAVVYPLDAVKVAMHGYRETFPSLAKAYDYLDKLGSGIYQAGEDARKSAKKYKSFQEALDRIAKKIRDLKTGAGVSLETDTGVSSGKQEKLVALEKQRTEILAKQNALQEKQNTLAEKLVAIKDRIKDIAISGFMQRQAGTEQYFETFYKGFMEKRGVREQFGDMTIPGTKGMKWGEGAERSRETTTRGIPQFYLRQEEALREKAAGIEGSDLASLMRKKGALQGLYETNVEQFGIARGRTAKGQQFMEATEAKRGLVEIQEAIQQKQVELMQQQVKDIAESKEKLAVANEHLAKISENTSAIANAGGKDVGDAGAVAQGAGEAVSSMINYHMNRINRVIWNPV